LSAPASAFHLSAWPLPSSREPLPVPAMPTPVCSLLELNFSLRALSFLPGLSFVSPFEGGCLRTSASHEVSYPPAFKYRSVHLPRPFHSRYVPPSPFLTTSTFYSAPTRSEVSLGYHSWGSSLQGSSRITEDRAVSDTVSPLDLPRGRSRLLRGRVASPCFRAGPPGSYSCDSTVSASFWFPIHRGPSPSWVFLLWDLASLSAPGPKPVHSQGRTAPSPVPN